jgi:hypothetical protein
MAVIRRARPDIDTRAGGGQVLPPPAPVSPAFPPANDSKPLPLGAEML